VSNDVSLREYIEKVESGHWEAHDREHESLANAMRVARDVVEGRLERLNELRTEVLTDRTQFIRRDVFEAYREAVEKRFRSLQAALLTLAGTLVLGVVLVITKLGR
jgi:hypothetical protein